VRPDAGGLVPEKILVVEDDIVNRTLLRDVLKYYGYEVIEAQDGREGVKLAKEHMPAIILMDVQMPEMDGIQATKILKSGPETKNIKIISLSAFVLDSETKDFLDVGFDDYISKPIDIKQLPALIKKHLD